MIAPGINGAHDLGGERGLGPIPIEPDEPVFHEPWEGLVLALSVAGVVSRTFAIDQARARVEEPPPVAYLSMSYYEQWLYSLEANLVASGVLAREQIEERVAALAEDPDAPLPPGENEELTGILRMMIAEGVPPQEVDGKPRFGPGDRVETKIIRVHRPGQEHTRLPGYAQGRTGVIEIVHPPQPLPDAVVAGRGMRPEYLYSVRFQGRDLWSDAGSESVNVDLWESYLKPAGEASANGGKRA